MHIDSVTETKQDNHDEGKTSSLCERDAEIITYSAERALNWLEGFAEALASRGPDADRMMQRVRDEVSVVRKGLR